MLIVLQKLALFSLSILALAQAVPLALRSSKHIVPNRGCGTVVSDTDRLLAERALDELRASQLDTREVVNGTEGLKPVSFDVYWHVIYANETREGGYVTDQQIAEQMTVLNADFASTNISWVFKNTTRIHNADWFVNVYPGSPQERDMKRRYHKGDSTVLNMFTAQFNGTTQTLGFASLPSSYQGDPIGDGVIVRHSVLPGGSIPNYNHGRTTVHEIGHWLGLYHTFEGGCDGVGDNIADTAPEASGAEGCPVGRRSCPDSKLEDPIRNFMDYSWDTCMTHFTPGQALRMHEVIWAFRTKRPPVVTPPQVEVATPDIPEVEVEIKPEDTSATENGISSATKAGGFSSKADDAPSSLNGNEEMSTTGNLQSSEPQTPISHLSGDGASEDVAEVEVVPDVEARLLLEWEAVHRSWWQDELDSRDYYQDDDQTSRRFWDLYSDDVELRWDGIDEMYYP